MQIGKLPFDSVTYRKNMNDLYRWASCVDVPWERKGLGAEGAAF